MKEFSIPMSIADMIPVFLFLITSIKLQRALYNKMSKGAFALFSAGTIYVFLAGFLKATYKLLYAMNICDFEVLSKLFFPIQSISFMLAGLGLVAMLTHRQGETSYAVAPAFFSGTILFVTTMILGLGMMDASLAILAKKLGKKNTVITIAISFVLMLCMGYLATKDFSVAWMNWLAEGINILGQGLLLLAVCQLEKAGLKDLEI